ncbi:hypothetical protein [Phocaeicola sp.]
MKKLIVLLPFIVFMLYSCTNNKRLSESKSLDYDSISISIDYPYLSHYSNCTSYVKEDTLYMVAYNYLTHAIDFIDMSGNGNHHTVSLQKEGDNGVAGSATLRCTPSGILVKELFTVKLLTYDGNVILNIPLHEITDSISGHRYSLCNQGVAPGEYGYIAYDAQSNSVFVPLFPLEETKLCDVSLGSQAFLSQRKPIFLNSSYPYPYSEITRSMGTHFMPHFTVADGQRLIYNFYGNSKFWIYNMATSQTIEMDMPSMFTDNVAEYPLGSSREIFEQESMSLRFREVHYIPSLRCFVRVHYAPRKTLFDKNISRFLMVMKEDDEKIYELLLPSSFDGRYFVSDAVVYFLMSGNDSDNEIKFGKVDLNKII